MSQARPMRSRRRAWLAELGIAALILLAIVQPAADLVGMPRLKALAAATGAAPAMKVFTAHDGFETYAAVYRLRWEDEAGQAGSIALTPALSARLRGPYNRRNVYGAVLSYGPVLRANPRTRPMLEAVSSYAFCRPGPVLHELGLSATRPRRVEVELQPRGAPPPQRLDLRWEHSCE